MAETGTVTEQIAALAGSSTADHARDLLRVQRRIDRFREQLTALEIRKQDLLKKLAK